MRIQMWRETFLTTSEPERHHHPLPVVSYKGRQGQLHGGCRQFGENHMLIDYRRADANADATAETSVQRGDKRGVQAALLAGAFRQAYQQPESSADAKAPFRAGAEIAMTSLTYRPDVTLDQVASMTSHQYPDRP